MHIKYPYLVQSQVQVILIHHLFILLGLRSISWCGHQVHISVPINALLSSGIDPQYIPSPQQLLLSDSVSLLFTTSWHGSLSLNLAIIGSISIFFAHHINAMPQVYPGLVNDYPTLVCLFTHHIMIGSLFIIGAGAHASLFIVQDYSFTNPYLHLILTHRDSLIGHLTWVSIFLGFHSFGLYIHKMFYKHLHVLKMSSMTLQSN
jgi:hypothetical protein